MKRTLVVSLLAALVVLLAPALMAGGQKEAPAAAKGPVKINFWHLWGGSRVELIDKMIKDYRATRPNVEIEATFTAPNDLQKKVVQAAGTGTLPDVFNLNSGWYEDLKPQETIEPLDAYVQKDKLDLKATLLAAEEARSWYQGKVYSLPNVLAGAQGLFFYNKGLMKKAGLDPDKDAPRNWDEFVKVSKTLLQKLNPDGKLEVIVWNPWIHVGQNMIQVFADANGAPTVSPDSRRSLFNTAGVIDAARKFDAYIQEVYGPFGGYKGLIEWGSRVLGADVGAAQVAGFAKEKQVFYVSGSWTIQQVNAANANMEMGILPIPGFKGQHGGFAKNGWSFSISKESKIKDAAWDFLKFITIDPKGNGEFCVAQGRPCPITAVNDDPRLTKQGELWTSLVKVMKMDLPIGYNDYFSSLFPTLNDIMSRRANGESIDSVMTYVHKWFQDYLNDLFKK